MTNYTTRAFAPCEDRTHDLRIAGESRSNVLLGLDYETCALPTELKGREYTRRRRTLGIKPRVEARKRCFRAKSVEKMGIDPIASCMLSTRSTI